MKSLLSLLFVFLSIQLNAAPFDRWDTPCDTIKLTDGRIILGHIYYEDRTVVRYNNCNEAIKTKDEIPMFQVKEIAYGSNRHNQPLAEDRSRLNRRGVYTIVIIGAVLIGALLAILFLFN